MPELPEVERARALIADRALGRVVAEVDDTDTFVCRPHLPGDIAEALRGVTLTAACRRGKSMWVETDGGEGPTLGLHLGMAGRIVVDGESAGDPGKYTAASERNPQWKRFTLGFEDGGTLVLLDMRRLGRVRLDPDLSDLGPDAMDITRAQFRERIHRSAMPLKARIMDQSVLAGVGNLLADELLWQARQPPLRPANDLDEAELDALRRVMRAATRRAIDRGGVHTGVVIPYRRRDERCPRCGAEMVRATVGGRTTWWCSDEQAWPAPAGA